MTYIRWHHFVRKITEQHSSHVCRSAYVEYFVIFGARSVREFMVTLHRNHTFNEADFELTCMLLQPKRRSYNLL